MKLCRTEVDFLEKLLLPQKLRNGSKIEFLNLKKNLVINFHWICSIMKISIICCVYGEIPYWKNFIPEILVKMLPPNQIVWFLKQLFVQNKFVKQPHFLHVDTNLQTLIDLNFFWSDMVKNECDQSGLGTLKLTLSVEWTDEVLHVGWVW